MRAYSCGNWASASDHIDILHTDIRRRIACIPEFSHIVIVSGVNRESWAVWAFLLKMYQYHKIKSKNEFVCLLWLNYRDVIHRWELLVIPHMCHQNQIPFHVFLQFAPRSPPASPQRPNASFEAHTIHCFLSHWLLPAWWRHFSPLRNTHCVSDPFLLNMSSITIRHLCLFFLLQ